MFTFVLSESTARLFTWTINPPLTAAFLGANNWAAFFLALLGARERIWGRARITFAVSIVFITLTLVATLLHLDKFNFDNADGWLWTIVYVGVPPLLVILFVGQLRVPGPDRAPDRPHRTLRPRRRRVAEDADTGAGRHPVRRSFDGRPLWPWTLTPLTARAVGAWVLALAAGLGATLWEGDWTRIRIATPTFAAIPLLQGVALARYSDTVDWHASQIWVYVGFLVAILALGLYGLWRGFVRRGARKGESGAIDSGCVEHDTYATKRGRSTCGNQRRRRRSP